MLSRSQRLSVEQFNVVMEKGRVYHSPFFLIRVLKIDKSTRISAVVSKKVSKTAVGRNGLRRKMYEAVARYMENVVNGVHAIVFAKDIAVKAEFRDLTEDMKSIFVKAGVLK